MLIFIIFTIIYNNRINFQQIVVNCLAYLIPLNIQSRNVSVNYKESGQRTCQALTAEVPQYNTYFETHAVQIFEQLLLNTCDEKFLLDHFDYSIDYITQEHNINVSDLEKCIEYLQVHLFCFHFINRIVLS